MILTFVIVTLAVYRISLMIATEDGPFDIFGIWREINLNEYGADNWVVRGIHCPLCVGFWLSFVGGLFLWDGLVNYLLYSVAIAGLQTFLVLLAGVPGGEDE